MTDTTPIWCDNLSSYESTGFINHTLLIHSHRHWNQVVQRTEQCNRIYDYSVCNLTPGVKIPVRHALVHIFAKYWPIFEILSLSCSAWNQFAIQWTLRIPSHLNRVATLPCKMRDLYAGALSRQSLSSAVGSVCSSRCAEWFLQC